MCDAIPCCTKLECLEFDFVLVVLSFPFRLFSKMFLSNRTKIPLNIHQIGSNKPDYWQKMSKFEPINK